MNSHSISVAMCTFNGEPFLGAQLESIAAQERLPDELVVCDDGSADRSVEIVRQFAQRARFPIRLIVNQKTLRATKNFEQAISRSQGAIVALADQDDVWYPQKLRRIEEAFQESSKVVGTFSDADLIDEGSQLLRLRLWPTFAFNPAKQNQFTSGHALSVLIRRPVVTGATMAFRRDLFDLMAPIPGNEIHDKWISFLLAALGQIVAISEPLMQYRRHKRQQVGPGPLTLREGIVRARDSDANSYLDEIERFQQIYDRLQERRSDFPYAECALQAIQGKISHLEHRAHLPPSKVARIPKILEEIFHGHYWRYSGGWMTVAKDLVMR
jgi:glycosyltransferase involved in cell wall biosynthesis